MDFKTEKLPNGIEVVSVIMNDAEKAEHKKAVAQEVWCDCEETGNASQAEKCFNTCEFMVDNGKCPCGVWKHHFHGGVCGKIVQIG